MFLNNGKKAKVAFAIAIIISIAKFGQSSEENDIVVEPSEDDEYEEVEPEAPHYEIPKGVQTLSFNPGNLTDEDQHAIHMPRDLLCDGCRAIAYVMKEKLKAIQSRYKKGHKLSEMDVVDILDNVCKDKEKKFEGYGMKEIMGKRRLSGEGLETKDVPGVMGGGGRWPFRLHELCMEHLGAIGEDAIYEYFLAGRSIENLICRNKENGNICPPKKKKKKKKVKQEKQEL